MRKTFLLIVPLLLAVAPALAQQPRKKPVAPAPAQQPKKPVAEADPTFHGVKLGRPLADSMPACKVRTLQQYQLHNDRVPERSFTLDEGIEGEENQPCYHALLGAVTFILHGGAAPHEQIKGKDITIVQFFDDNAVQRIILSYKSPADGPRTLTDLTSKFGQPTCTHVETKTPGGAKNCAWKTKWGTVLWAATEDGKDGPSVVATLSNEAHEAMKPKTRKDEF